MTLLTQMWFAVLFVAAGKAVGLMGLPSVHIVTWIIRGMADVYKRQDLYGVILTTNQLHEAVKNVSGWNQKRLRPGRWRL